MAQASNNVLNLPLVIAVPSFELGLAFANILASTIFTCGQINYKGGGTSHVMFDFVCFAGVGAAKVLALLYYWAGMAFSTFEGTRVIRLGCFFWSTLF